MLKDSWKRIAGIYSLENGNIAAVWLAHDPDTDTVHVFDAALYQLSGLAEIASALNGHGRYIPICWADKDVRDALEENGCNMMRDPCKDSPGFAEMVSKGIDERMRTGRFRVDSRLAEWKKEYESYYREDAKVPTTSHPLMIATRFAMSQIKYGTAPSSARSRKNLAPKMAIV